MAHIFNDSLDSHAAVADLARKWDAAPTTSQTLSTTTGRLGGVSLTGSSATAQGILSKALPTPHCGVGQDTLFLSASIYMLSTPTNLRHLMSAVNTGPSSTTGSNPAGTLDTWVCVGINVTGQLVLLRNNTVIATADMPLALGAWLRVEMRVANIDDTGGTAEIRLNGVTVIDFTGDLYQVGPKSIYSASFHTSGSWRLDDPQIHNSAGSTMNGFLGDLVMETIRPTGPGTTTQSTPTGAATAWQAVSEVVPNNDTSYAAISTVGSKDTYVYGDLTAGAATATVHAVVATMTARTPGMSPRKIAPVARLAGTETDGAPQAVLIEMTNAYRAEQTVLPRPGGGAWTAAEVNAAEFGWKVTQ